MKFFLNVLIARSTALQRFISWGASWKSMSLDLSYLWKAGEASLSSLMYADLRPLVSKFSCRSLKTRIHLLSDLDFMGWINKLFILYSKNTNWYLFTLLDVTGNLPVRYVAICLLWLIILVNTMLVLLLILVVSSHIHILIPDSNPDPVLFPYSYIGP